MNTADAFYRIYNMYKNLSKKDRATLLDGMEEQSRKLKKLQTQFVGQDFQRHKEKNALLLVNSLTEIFSNIASELNTLPAVRTNGMKFSAIASDAYAGHQETDAAGNNIVHYYSLFLNGNRINQDTRTISEFIIFERSGKLEFSRNLHEASIDPLKNEEDFADLRCVLTQQAATYVYRPD